MVSLRFIVAVRIVPRKSPAAVRGADPESGLTLACPLWRRLAAALAPEHLAFAICERSFTAKDAKGLEIVASFGAAVVGRCMSLGGAPKESTISRPVFPLWVTKYRQIADTGSR